MGVMQIIVTVRNMAEPERAWGGSFLVDADLVDCLVPGSYLRAIGIEPRSTRKYELADGSEVDMDVAGVELEFMGDMIGATVIFAPDDTEPILGRVALESMGLVVDPDTERLKRLPATRLK